jgi:hypothetical protein
LALGTYLLLTLLGAALGLSINDRVSDRSLTIGAVVWTILVTAWSLFVGGFIASLFTTGENKYEGVVLGLGLGRGPWSNRDAVRDGRSGRVRGHGRRGEYGRGCFHGNWEERRTNARANGIDALARV